MESKHHIVIPESQDGPSEIAEVLIARGVVPGFVLMPCAVEFDPEVQGNTPEIEKVRRLRVLASEFETQHAAVPKPVPECFLLRRFSSSQLPGSRTVSLHTRQTSRGYAIPSPRPSPLPGRGRPR